MATPTYLPAPIKVKNNHIDTKSNWFLWVRCSAALGILAYYAPKTFLATSVGIFAYQVHSFNQLVHTADNSKHEQIHAWAIKACVVMVSIGTVFGINALPYYWSAVKDLRHLQLIHCVGHLAKGAIMMLVAVCSTSFYKSAKDHAGGRTWVEMEDYVKNYPAEVKQEILSSYGLQFAFYISALLPQTGLAAQLSKRHFAFSQFQSEGNKFSILQNYFRKVDMRHWPLAIHQFQQLPVKSQILLGPQLSVKSQRFSDAERDALPDAVKAVILNETLKDFGKVPTDQELAYPMRQAFGTAFERLPREQQSILGEELLRLIQAVPQESIGDYFTERMRLIALKIAADNFIHLEHMEALVDYILNGLSEPFKEEYRLYYREQTALMKKFYRRDLDVLPDSV
jgi:hypothetical protein